MPQNSIALSKVGVDCCARSVCGLGRPFDVSEILLDISHLVACVGPQHGSRRTIPKEAVAGFRFLINLMILP